VRPGASTADGGHMDRPGIRKRRGELLGLACGRARARDPDRGGDHGAPARTFEQWARDHADDFRPLSATEIAAQCVSAFRAGRMDLAMRLTKSPGPVEARKRRSGRWHSGLYAVTSGPLRVSRDRFVRLRSYLPVSIGPELRPTAVTLRFCLGVRTP
jgi:hypothetical protein